MVQGNPDVSSLLRNVDTDNLSLGAPAAESTAMDIADSPEDPTEEDQADENILSFFKGPRGGKNCSFNGRCYTYDRFVSRTDTTYWQCARRKEFTPQCTGRLYSRQNEVIRVTNHVCVKSIDYVIKKRTLSDIRFESAASEKPASIISRNMMNVPESVRVILPDVENMKRSVRQYRAKSRPCAPSETNFLIPDEYTVDADGNRFLLADKLTESQERLLVFQFSKIIFQFSKIIFLYASFLELPYLYFHHALSSLSPYIHIPSVILKINS